MAENDRYQGEEIELPQDTRIEDLREDMETALNELLDFIIGGEQ